MKRYWAFFRAELMSAMAYRTDFFFSFLADFLLIFVKLAVWMAVFQHRSTVAGFSFVQMVTYLFVSQTVSNIYAFKNDASRPISVRILKGTISFDLIIDFKADNPQEIQNKVLKEIKEKYPNYNYNVILDTDVSD